MREERVGRIPNVLTHPDQLAHAADAISVVSRRHLALPDQLRVAQVRTSTAHRHRGQVVEGPVRALRQVLALVQLLTCQLPNALLLNLELVRREVSMLGLVEPGLLLSRFRFERVRRGEELLHSLAHQWLLETFRDELLLLL